MSSSDLENEVMALIREDTMVPLSEISLRSTLLGDLGVDGDDAWSLIEVLREKYGIDLSEFEFRRYFRNEPCFKGPIYLLRKLLYRDEHLAAGKAPVTVSMLVDACASGVWRRGE